jgi:lysophospholipase L1-like esterase
VSAPDGNPPLQEVLARLQRHEHQTVVALGDSNTANAHFTRGAKQWPELMGQELRERYGTQDITVVNSGISGDSVTEARRRLHRDVLRLQPQLVVICLGSNDANRLDDTTFTTLLEEIVSEIAGSGAALILRTPAPIVEKQPEPKHLWAGDHTLRAKISIIRAVASRRHITLVDTYEQFWQRERSGMLDCASLFCDEVHLNAAGHRLVWRGLAPALGCPAELTWER